MWYSEAVKRWLVSQYKTVKGVRYGPYLVEQWRTSDGVLHSEYIGKARSAADQVEHEARKVARVVARSAVQPVESVDAAKSTGDPIRDLLASISAKPAGLSAVPVSSPVPPAPSPQHTRQQGPAPGKGYYSDPDWDE